MIAGSDRSPGASHEPDHTLGEMDRQRLLALRRQTAEVMAGDDGSPYEWTVEGTADMRETLRAAHRGQRRAAETND